MGKPLSESARGVGAPPCQAVSHIVPQKHTPCPPLGLLAGGHPICTVKSFIINPAIFRNKIRIVKFDFIAIRKPLHYEL